MKNNQETFYEFIMEVIKDLKLKKVYDSLNIENDILDELYKKSLDLLDNYEGANEFNPNLNSVFILKVLINCQNKLYFKLEKEKLSILTLTTNLIDSYEHQIISSLKKHCIENISSLEVALIKNISVNSLLINDRIIEHLDLKKPIIYGVYEVKVENLLENDKFIELTEKSPKLNPIDLAIVENLKKGEMYVNSH